MAIYAIGFFGWSLWYGQSRLSNGWKHALYLTHWGYFCFVIWATVDFVIVADRYRSQANAGHVKWFTKIPKNPLGKRNVLLINNSMSIQSTHSKQVLFISISIFVGYQYLWFMTNLAHPVALSISIGYFSIEFPHSNLFEQLDQGIVDVTLIFYNFNLHLVQVKNKRCVWFQQLLAISSSLTFFLHLQSSIMRL